jgi:uncharacterized protein (TIGR03067 family)
VRLHQLVILGVCLSLGADAPKNDAVKKELKKVEGEWALVSGEEKGENVPEETLKNAMLTIVGDKHTLKINGDTIAGSHKVGPTKKPKEIDVMETEGPFSGQTLLGIYKLEGDTFSTCLALPGQERPKEFSTKSGTGSMLHVWKRVKK